VANRVQWDPRLSVGNDTLDAQHRDLLAHCNALADCLAEAGEEADKAFRRLFEELMALSREHFAAEEALLARAGYPDLEAHRNEREEFDYLAAEIITTEHFDKGELQTFLALWWTGHILGSANKQRAFLERQPAA
jgi:hemerythrin